MKKIYYFILLLVLLVLVTANITHSASYTIRELGSIGSSSPQLNNNGHVVWDTSEGPGLRTIYHYNGIEAIPLSTNTSYSLLPHINDNDNVVWYSNNEIFLHDGSTITQITNNSVGDYTPQINDNGYVVWRGGEDIHNNEIFLYNGVTTTQISNYSDSAHDLSPQISNNGNVAWAGFVSTNNHEIFYYNGITTTQLTNNSYNDLEARINNNGDVVWSGRDGWIAQIFLYDGITTTQLTNNSLYNTDPQINNNGDIVWAGSDHSDPDVPVGDIFLYSEGSITQLTDDGSINSNPNINDNGDVVWCGWDGLSNGIFLYDGTGINRIATTAECEELQINNNGDIVWEVLNSKVYMATVVPEPARVEATVHFGGYVIDKGSLTSGELDVLDIGDTISGTITYDPNSPDTNSWDVVGEYKFDSSNSSLSLTMHDISDGHSEIFNETGFLNEINVTDNWSYPGYPTIDGFNPNGEFSLNGELIDFYIYFQNRNTGLDIFDTDELPNPLPPYDQFNYTRMKLNSRTVIASYVDIATTWSQVVLPPVRIDGATLTYYSTLQEAYDNALNGDTIRCKEMVFTEYLFIDDINNKHVTFQGGYNDDYSEIVGTSSLEGKMIISNGMVIIENLLLQ